MIRNEALSVEERNSDRFYRASRNKQIQSDDEFLRGPRKSKVRFHDFIYMESQHIRIAYIVMIQFMN